jgi:tetratricopeptide (TPR) repeat protein
MMPPEVQHARALERRARELQSAGRYAEALAPLQEAISFWQARDGAHSLDALAGLMNLAVARRRMGDAAQAAAMLEAVAPQLANNEDPEASGIYHSALNNLATAYRELGRDADARRAWERLAGRLASVGDRESWARVSSNLSTLLAGVRVIVDALNDRTTITDTYYPGGDSAEENGRACHQQQPEGRLEDHSPEVLGKHPLAVFVALD